MEKLEDKSIPKPTVELVLAEEARFDRDDEVTERALTELIKRFPQNTDRSQILLKVAAINQLYSTHIYAVRNIADHIAELNIDGHLRAGSIQLVDKIARVRVGNKKERNYLSFASKYCSWHRPESYPVYDSRAEKCLWAYKRQFGLSFARKDLWHYISFCDAVKEFRDRFELHPMTFKQIDKFLYLKGSALIEAPWGRFRPRARARGPGEDRGDEDLSERFRAPGVAWHFDCHAHDGTGKASLDCGGTSTG